MGGVGEVGGGGGGGGGEAWRCGRGLASVDLWEGGGGGEGNTAVVLDAHGDGGFAVGRGDVRGVGGVYVDELVGGGVVGGAGGDAEEVFVCHGRLDIVKVIYGEGSKVA